MRERRWNLGLALLVLAAVPLAAQDDEEGREVSEIAAAQDPVRNALDHGIAYLRGLAEKDDEHFTFPPTRQRKVIDHEMVEQRFSRRTFEEPVYEYRTEEVWRNVKVGSSVDAVTVRQKVKVRKRVGVKGTREVERVVRDPEGDIVKEVRRPVYGPGGPDRWRDGQFGHNAMALYAMMEAGVSPADDVIMIPAERLAEIYKRFGLPDLTWDLVWTIAAFSRLPEEPYGKLARASAMKLLEAQHTEDERAGMWGPVSVSRQRLAHVLMQRDSLARRLLALTQNNRGDEIEGPEIAGVRIKLETLEDELREVTMLGHDPLKIHTLVRIDREGLRPIEIWGPPEYIYNQTTADLESTTLAMFGLRIAKDAKLLPMETSPPMTTGRFPRPIYPPRKTADILREAVRAITRLQMRNGAWNAANFHAPVTDLEDIANISGIPPDERAFEPLDSPANCSTIAYGYGGLVSAVEIFGEDALAPFAGNMHFGNVALKHCVEGTAKGELGPLEGRALYPYEMFFHARRELPVREEDAAPGVVEFGTHYLLGDQNKDGSWGGKPRAFYFFPTSLEARIAAGLPAASEHPHDAFDLTKPHVPFDPEGKRGRHHAGQRRALHAPIATSYAMLFLVQQTDTPAGDTAVPAAE